MANISELRNTLAAAITCGEETKGPIIQILVTDLPLRKKFDCVDFCQLLQNNSQSVASVKSLLQGLSILEKYGRHLLKPSESRSSLWTQIKFSNSIFRERVNTIEGGRDIMHKLGYTLEKPDSLCFPPNTEPDHGRVLNIVLDLAIGRKELEMYLEGQHPHPHYIEALLTPQFRSQLSGRSSQPAPGNQSMAQPLPTQALPRFEPGRGPVPGSHDERAQPMLTPAQQGQRSVRLDQGRVLTPAVLDENNTGAAGAPQSMVIPNDHGASRSDDLATGTQSLMPNMVGRSNQQFQQEKSLHLNPLFIGNSMVTGPPNTNQPPQSNLDISMPNLLLQHQQHHQMVPHQLSSSSLSPALFQQNIPDQSTLMLQTQHGQFSQSNPVFQPNTSNQSQNLLHHQHLNQTSQSNDNLVPALPGYHVSLTGDPLEFPPNRQPPGEYQGARPKQTPNPCPEPAGLVASPGNIEVPQSPGTVCEICGYNAAEVLCQDQMCANKMLCLECNTKWHSHPKRANHQVERLHPLTSPGSARAPDRLRSDDGNTPQQGENQYRQNEGRISGGNSMMGYGYPQHGMQNTPLSHHQRNPSTNQQMGMPQTPTQSGGYQGNYNQGLHGNHQYPAAEHMMQQGYMYTNQAQYPMPPSIFPSGMVTSGHMLYQPAHYQPSIPVYIQGYGMGSPEEHGMFQSRSDTTLNRHSGYDQTGYNDNNIRHSVSAPKGMEQKKITTPTSAGSAGSMPSWYSGSTLLPKILEIKDLGSRHAKLEITLMTLQDDLKDYDQKINDIMIENPDFFHDENYQNYARKKRKHLQEIKELSKHKLELESSQDVQPGKIDQQNGANETMETLKKRLSDMTFSKPSGSPFFPTVASPENLRPGFQPLGPPVVSYPYPSYPPGTLTTPSATPVNTTGTSQNYPQVLKLSGPDNVSSNTSTLESPWRPGVAQNIPNIFSGGGDNNMDVIRQMLVLDQNPHAPISGIGNVSGQAIGQVPVAYPPNIIDTGPSSVHEPGTNKTSDEKWQCEHCTLLNDMTTNICTACEKTSTRLPSGCQPKSAVNSGELQQEPCEHCTSYNPVGTKVCSVCCRSQDKYQAKLHVSTSAAKLVAQQKDSQSSEGVGSPFELVPRTNESEQKSPELTAAASGVGKMINEEQDKVYLEKKQAHEEYAKRMKHQGQMSSTCAPSTNQSDASKARQPQTAIFPPEFSDYVAVQESDCSAEAMAEAARNTAAAVGPPKPSAQIAKGESHNKNLSRVLKNTEQGSNSGDEAFSSAPTSLEPTIREITEVTYQTPPEAPDTEKGFVDTMQKLTQERDQKQVNLEGRTLFSIIKMASEEGYTVPEAELAFNLEENDPLQYLKNVWPSLIEHVAYHAAEEGKKGPQNSVGDVSTQEAKEALLACKGDLDAAIKKCVEDRIVKYGMVSQQGEFAREEILTALFQHQGDVMESLDQLNHSVIKPVSDRVWNAGDADAGREALFGAGNQTNSISNSVIRCDDFQRLVKNKELPKEKRVRMIFIEGKLKSWGRAEMVIRILDEDLQEDDGTQTWTLEDIIDAVRNCGDHRSSLVYLNQECELCFCLYPMSKIMKLGTCNCNMCKGCVKQNFEVAIREHHVRNWNCPLCQSPSLEDDQESSSYFEFLVLLLQNLVAKETLEIFETKLRDWHLQKDPNFRWCAHCVTGFIWDQPDQLEMTCPPCKEKTCFKCKKKWEDQHRGLTCEQFTQWKIDNDPERQSKGVQLYLEENGIDCPGCKMRYSLAKGGCMHFTCPQCGFQFCSGCQQAFHKDGTCKMLRSCQARGLHCHHPRDCFYYLRDNDVPQLQKLLKNHKVAFNTDPPETQADRAHCFVMEQKESGVQKKDEACGHETSPGMAGLCSNHYKEYLVSLINKNKIDPIEIMDMNELKILIERDDKQMPPVNKNETEAAYRKRVEKFIKERLKLHR